MLGIKGFIQTQTSITLMVFDSVHIYLVITYLIVTLKVFLPVTFNIFLPLSLLCFLNFHILYKPFISLCNNVQSPFLYHLSLASIQVVFLWCGIHKQLKKKLISPNQTPWLNNSCHVEFQNQEELKKTSSRLNSMVTMDLWQDKGPLFRNSINCGVSCLRTGSSCHPPLSNYNLLQNGSLCVCLCVGCMWCGSNWKKIKGFSVTLHVSVLFNVPLHKRD